MNTPDHGVQQLQPLLGQTVVGGSKGLGQPPKYVEKRRGIRRANRTSEDDGVVPD